MISSKQSLQKFCEYYNCRNKGRSESDKISLKNYLNSFRNGSRTTIYSLKCDIEKQMIVYNAKNKDFIVNHKDVVEITIAANKTFGLNLDTKKLVPPSDQYK